MEIEEKNFRELKQGQKFKNFKELSKYLGCSKIPSGNSKIKLLKEIRCYCDIKQVGNQIIIGEVFESPKKIIDKRSLRNTRHTTGGKYKDTIEELILYIISKENKGKEQYYTIGELSQKIGLYKVEFGKLKNDELEIIDMLQGEQKALLKTALKSLMSKNIIILEDTYIVINKKLQSIAVDETNFIGADEIEKIYEDVKEEFINTFGKNYLRDIKIKSRFYECINSKVNDLTIGTITGVYKAIKIKLVGKKSKLKANEFNQKRKEFKKNRKEALKRNKEILFNKKNYELRKKLRIRYQKELNKSFNTNDLIMIWEGVKLEYEKKRIGKKKLNEMKMMIDKL